MTLKELEELNSKSTGLSNPFGLTTDNSSSKTITSPVFKTGTYTTDAADMTDLTDTESSLFSGVGDYFGRQKLGDIVGLGGLAYGIGDDLLGTGGKAKKQQLANMKKSSVLLDQQIANNAQSMADRKAFNEGMADASRQAMGLGTVYNYDKK
jgi:hypothetical protein